MAVRGPDAEGLPDSEIAEVQKKKVRFGLYPDSYGHVPWSRDMTCRPQEKESLRDGSVLYPIHSSFKDSAYILRAEREPDDRFSCFGICVLIVCLIVLFLLVWFVMSKVLLLEVENQVNRRSPIHAGGAAFRFVREVT
jgi:hypothetical protein